MHGTLLQWTKLRCEVKVRVECLCLYWITLSATGGGLPRGPVRAIPHGSSVTTGGNLSTRTKPAMLGRVKLDNTLLTCDKGNFNQITARSRNRTLITMVRGTCTTTLPPAPLLMSKPKTILSHRIVIRMSHNVAEMRHGWITIVANIRRITQALDP